MSEFWKFCSENKEAILTIGTCVATGLGTALGFLIKSNVVSRRKLKAAQRSCYQIKCPHCKKWLRLLKSLSCFLLERLITILTALLTKMND